VEDHPKKHRGMTNRARYLRQNLTPAERKLWNSLRNRQLDGCKFYRQYPLGPYVTDFFCRTERLAIEIDGDVHAAQTRRDLNRDAYLASEDIRVARFTNRQVLYEMDNVVLEISRLVEERKASKNAE
jgi:very-short-patch-repair endonuclease